LTEKNKIRFGIAAFIFVILHFLLIFLYAAPDSAVPAKVKSITTHYVYPVFDQRWSLFAPCPVYNHQIELKYEFANGDTTNWIRLTDSAWDYHRWFRGSHHGELILAEYNLGFWIGTDMRALDLNLDEKIPDEKRQDFFDGYSYFKSKRYAYGTAHYLYERRPIAAEMKCRFVNVKTTETGSLVLPKFNWEGDIK
jgi:hypothetical protein